MYNTQQLNATGPVLLVANHPNSFFDAIVIAANCRRPLHFLARGDAFNKNYHRFLLGLLNMIPIYRQTEGKEQLILNEYAFKRSQEILLSGGMVLIFIEGICVNSHHLQPFKKGASRIAEAYQGVQPLKIVPIGLGYDSFKNYGKTIKIHVGTAIDKSWLFPYEEVSRNRIFFNEELKAKLEGLIKIPSAEPSIQKRLVKVPAVIGVFLHRPLYSAIRGIVAKRTAGTVFYDSVLFGVLLIIYPVYLLILLGLVYWLTDSWLISLLVIVTHVITARLAILNIPPQR